MAQDFEAAIGLVDASSGTILTTNSDDVVVGLILCNQDTDDNVIDLIMNDGSNDRYIYKGLSLPAGATVQVLTGGAKFVMLSGWTLKGDITTGTANDTHFYISYIDAAS